MWLKYKAPQLPFVTKQAKNFGREKMQPQS